MGNDSQLTVVEDAKKDEFVTQVRRNVETSQYLNELRANIRGGQGYVEISRHSFDYPALCVCYMDRVGVVQAFPNAETSLILKGTGIFKTDETIDLPVMGEMTPFTGDFIISADVIIETVGQFIENFDLDTVGEWCRL